MLTPAERELLALVDEDGFPLIILAHPNDQAERKRTRETAMSLLARGLIEVYGKPDDASALPPLEAEAVLGAPGSWDPDFPTDPLWFICASSAGNAELQDT